MREQKLKAVETSGMGKGIDAQTVGFAQQATKTAGQQAQAVADHGTKLEFLAIGWPTRENS